MRRKGYAPAQGVRLDVGFVDPHSARSWHRKGMPCAVVQLHDADDIQGLDLRFLLGLDAVIVGPAYQAPERFVLAVAAVALVATPSWRAGFLFRKGRAHTKAVNDAR